MSIIDYGQSAEDHQSLLVLVRHTGQKLQQQSFRKVWERVQKLSSVSIPGQKRNAWVRYKQNYSKENNEWGDFQAHRKALGLISIGECSSVEEFENLFDNYKNVKEEYASTLFNSRLIVFGMNRDGSPLCKNPLNETPSNSSDKLHIGDERLEESGKSTASVQRHSSNDDSPSHSEDSGVTSDVSPSDPVCDSNKSDTTNFSHNPTNSTKKSEEGQITFISKKSVKKQDSNSIKQQNSPAGTPPLKRPHSNSITKESSGAEVLFFPSLQDSSDLEEKLKEFITSLFFVLEGKRLDRSFERLDRIQLLCAPFEKKDYVGLDTDTKSFRKKCQGRLRKHLADLCLQAGIPGEAILHYQTAIDILRPVNDALWIGACYEGLSSASVIITYPKTKTQGLRRNFSLSTKRGSSMMNETKLRTGSINNKTANGLDDYPEGLTKTALDPTDIVEKYKEALINYSKFKNAAVIELEASLKACRVLIVQEKFLQASDFLQNVIYINFHVSDEDKIHRYCTLSHLYSQIGFHRKSSFFKRIAAMQCVSSPQSTLHNWSQCYNLLIQALDGYSIDFNPKSLPKDFVQGWPVLQSRVLNELIYSARKMGKNAIAVRHTTFLLHSLHQFLSASEKREMCNTLEQLTSKCEGSCTSLALDNGMILPPVPLTGIPYIKSFKLVRMRPHLEPVKLKRNTKSADAGPFIFTPIQLGKRKGSMGQNKLDFCLVARDLCEVQLQVCNPLPDELKITQMGLIVEGVEVESYPTNPSIPAESGPYLVKVLSRPKDAGEMNITGYLTQLLGVKSQCRLRDLPHLPVEKLTVDVIPPLPQIQLTTSLPKADSFLSGDDSAYVVTSGTTVIYAGQSLECLVTIQNISFQPVEHIDVQVSCKPEEREYLSKVFQWSSDNISSQLPLQPNSIMCFTLCINGSSDFLITEDQDVTEPKCVESLLRVEYSGGPGLEADFCRQCAVNLSVDISLSVIIQSWDVLPAQSCDHCYLVFDVQNLSGHPLDLYYSTETLHLTKDQIERITLEIERCVFPPVPDDVHLRNKVKQLETANHHSSYLNQFVDVQWEIPSMKVSGKVSIDHIVWTDKQLEQIQVSQISWDVKVNGEFCSLKDVKDVCVSDNIDINACVTLKEGVTDRSALLCIACRQSDENCDTVSVLGVNSVYYKEVIAGEALRLDSTFVIHCEGHYKLDVKCVLKTTDCDTEEQTFYYHPINLSAIDRG